MFVLVSLHYFLFKNVKYFLQIISTDKSWVTLEKEQIHTLQKVENDKDHAVIYLDLRFYDTVSH